MCAVVCVGGPEDHLHLLLVLSFRLIQFVVIQCSTSHGRHSETFQELSCLRLPYHHRHAGIVDNALSVMTGFTWVLGTELRSSYLNHKPFTR